MLKVINGALDRYDGSGFRRWLRRAVRQQVRTMMEKNGPLALKQATPDGEELKKLETPRGFLRLIGV